VRYEKEEKMEEEGGKILSEFRQLQQKKKAAQKFSKQIIDRKAARAR
jgi:cell fate (sporulation/competence/biofilm development) regulator YlbF (YheA/YmcA/DUF963 family)